MFVEKERDESDRASRATSIESSALLIMSLVFGIVMGLLLLLVGINIYLKQRTNMSRINVSNNVLEATWPLSEVSDQDLQAFDSSQVKLLGVNLEGAQISDRSLQWLSNHHEIKRIVLNRTMITDEGLYHLSKLTSLESLELKNTSITDLGLSYLAALPHLKSLVLSGTKITDSGLVALSHTQGLECLHMARTKLSGSGLIHLEHLPQLKELNLAYTLLDDSTAQCLKKFEQLEVLDISGTRISDQAFESFQEYEKIRELICDGVEVDGSGVRYLQRALALERLSFESTNFSDQALQHCLTLNWSPVRFPAPSLNVFKSKLTDRSAFAVMQLESSVSVNYWGTDVMPIMNQIEQLKRTATYWPYHFEVPPFIPLLEQ